MELSRYLLFTGRLTRSEYQDLTLDQHLWGVQGLEQFPPDGLCPRHLDEIADLEEVRELPFLDILRGSKFRAPVCTRSGLNLEALVDKCNEWHRDALEPICTYSTRSKFGRGVYERQFEKKLVGQYLVAAKARDGSTLVGDGNSVVLFEGSSGLYVGLAIAAAQPNVTVITPNTALIREHRDNPALAQKLKLEIVGGTADHGGVYGETCVQQLTQAITKEPPATVLVVTVTALLPTVGPFDTGQIGEVKRDMILRALESKVKALVFVADYSKHFDAPGKALGSALYTAGEWRTMTSKHQGKIHIVTSPPPQIRAALADGRIRGIHETRATSVTSERGFNAEDVQYNHAAIDLHRLLGSDLVRGEAQPRFHEAFKVILDRAYYEKIRGAGSIAVS